MEERCAMRVRCVSDYVTEQQRAALGRRQYQGNLELGLTIGAEYLVLGLGFEADSNHGTTGPNVTVLLENGSPGGYDLCLFEVIDPRVSRYWEMCILEFDSRQIVELLPPTFPKATVDALDHDAQDKAYIAFLASDAFRDTCALLKDEFTLTLGS
jgi:hypothetical protein